MIRDLEHGTYEEKVENWVTQPSAEKVRGKSKCIFNYAVGECQEDEAGLFLECPVKRQELTSTRCNSGNLE